MIKTKNVKRKTQNHGFSLLEVIVGTALMLTFFLGVFGALNAGVKLVGRSKAKAGALAIANERMENIRNRPYGNVGTAGGIPAGNIPQTSTISLNGIEYTGRTLIQYVDDSKDGLGGADENGITSDYKRVKVAITWPNASRPVALISDIMPKGIETTAGGGTLIINVLNAGVQPVSLASVHIENSSIVPPVSLDVFTNSQGKVIFPGSPSSSNYEITATKAAHSVAKTYSADAINVNPEPRHLTIIEGETTEASFVIDKVSAKTVRTWEPIKDFSWSDYFDDWSKISSFSSTSVSAGLAGLAEESPGVYFNSGFLISLDIGGIENLNSWNEFSWNNIEPAGADVKYQLIRYQGSDLVLIPDSDLPGNSVGFDASPINLSGLSTTTYPTLKLKANLSASDTSFTPSILDWRISWKAGPFPLANAPFHARGQKIIGTNASGASIYKYSEDLATNLSGQLQINNLEFDVYDITVNGPVAGYDISESCPSQPVNILPDTINATDLYLVNHTNNTLLIKVKNAGGSALGGANVRLYKTGYDAAKTSSGCGQSFFSSLSVAEYTAEASRNGYNMASSTVSVSGQTTLEIIMNEL